MTAADAERNGRGRGVKALARRAPAIPARWSYRASVKRMKAVVWKWKRITATMLRELWVAHEVLTRPGARSDLAANTTRSWESYCEEIGLNRVTAWRWLKLYDPAGRKLIEADSRSARRGETALVVVNPEDKLIAELRPRLAKMTPYHRLRVAFRILAGR
jgi:hypothetical protein